MKFECSTCSKAIQEARRCQNNSFENEGAPFPIRLFEGSRGHQFCPAKLFRDDSGFCSKISVFYLAWELGQMPFGGTIDTMNTEDLECMNYLIMTWKHYEKAESFHKLGTLLLGKKK